MEKSTEVETTEIVVPEANTPICKIWGSDFTLAKKDEIDYYHAVMKQVTLENMLVGTITDEGEYLLANNIKRDLMRMQKEIADESDRYYIAFASYMEKTFHFSIEVEDLNDSEVSATLYLTEQVVNYPYFESVRSFIARATLTKNENLKASIFKTFNIVDTIPLIDDLKVPNLAVLMQKLLDQKLIFEQIADIGAQIYIMRTLQVLESAGEVGQKVIEEYKKEADALDLDTNEKGTYTTLQKVLDKTLEENGGLEKLPLPDEVKTQPKIEYTQAIKKLDEKAKNNSEQKHDSGDKKVKVTEVSKAGAKKPASKSSSKKPAGGTKPKKAKKDDGKEKKKGDKKLEDMLGFGQETKKPSASKEVVVEKTTSATPNTAVKAPDNIETKPTQKDNAEIPEDTAKSRKIGRNAYKIAVGENVGSITKEDVYHEHIEAQETGVIVTDGLTVYKSSTVEVKVSSKPGRPIYVEQQHNNEQQ